MQDGQDSNTYILLGSAVGMRFLDIFAQMLARILTATAYSYRSIYIYIYIQWHVLRSDPHSSQRPEFSEERVFGRPAGHFHSCCHLCVRLASLVAGS